MGSIVGRRRARVCIKLLTQSNRRNFVAGDDLALFGASLYRRKGQESPFLPR